eukprot:Em0001g2284a
MHNQVTEAEFEVEWNKLKNADLFMSKPTIIHFFENSLIPMFKLLAAIWILKSAGISNPNEGVTNNCSESMNAVLHRLQQWKQVPLDVIAVSLYHLSVFYYREIERSVHQCGRWEVKEEYDHCKRDPSLMPRLEAVPDPQQIGGTNIAELQRRDRRKRERPSGKKQPRKHDFGEPKGSVPMFLEFQKLRSYQLIQHQTTPDTSELNYYAGISIRNDLSCDKFLASPAEKALKAALCTMLDGDVHNGKTIMLDHIKSVLPLKTYIRMWKSWSVHPHLNAEPAQGQGYDTRLQVCISAHLVFTVLKQAAVVSCPAFVRCMNVIGYISCIMPLLGLVEMAPSVMLLLLFSHQNTSFSNSNVTFDAGLITLGTKEPSAEQQGHTVVDAVTRSTTHLVQTNIRHGSSRGHDQMFEHTTHFNSFKTVALFWLANGG